MWKDIPYEALLQILSTLEHKQLQKLKEHVEIMRSTIGILILFESPATGTFTYNGISKRFSNVKSLQLGLKKQGQVTPFPNESSLYIYCGTECTVFDDYLPLEFINVP